MKQSQLSKLSTLLLSVTLGLGFTVSSLSVSSPGYAINQDALYWVSDASVSGSSQIFGSLTSPSVSPVAITPNTPTSRVTGAALTSDGSYLYFVDNFQAGTSKYDLVRTDRSGANRTVLASSISAPAQIAVSSGWVYYTIGATGVWAVNSTGSLPASPVNIVPPDGIVGPNNNGYSGIAVNGNDIYVSIKNGVGGGDPTNGLYHGTLSSGLLSGNLQQNTDHTAFENLLAYKLAFSGGYLYATSFSGAAQIYKTADWNAAVSSWTGIYTGDVSYYSNNISVLGSTIYFTSFTSSIYKVDSSGSSAATVAYAPSGSPSVGSVVAIAPQTLTYIAGSGTGANLTQTLSPGQSVTLPSPAACPLSATDPCFTAPSGQRQNGWVDLSGGPTYYSTGQTITPSSNLTLTARWTGGPVQYSTTSFLTTPNPMASIAFPNTAVGSSSQITIYAYNSGSTSTSISNETVGGTGVSRQGGSCNASGGTIAAGSECTVILQWNPSAAGALLNGSYSMQVSGSYFDAVTLTGTAATPYTVTFNPGGGTGTMGNQTAAGPNNLNANSFTKAGYTFRYWSTFSDGSGTTYLNQGQYPFSGNATLFAQWLADSHVVTYNTQGGSAVSNGAFLTGATMALPAAPTKSGYTFDGWFTSATGGTALTSPYTPGVITDITLYAQWSVDTSANGSSSSTSGLPHTGSNGESLIGFASLLFLGGITLLAIAIIRRRSV